MFRISYVTSKARALVSGRDSIQAPSVKDDVVQLKNTKLLT